MESLKTICKVTAFFLCGFAFYASIIQLLGL